MHPDGHLRPVSGESTERVRELVSQGFAFLFTVIGAILVFQPHGLIAEFILRVSFTGVLTIVPAVILSMYWRLGEKHPAIASKPISPGVLVVLLAGASWPPGLYSGVWVAAVEVVVIIVGSPISEPTTDERIIREFNLP